MAELDLYQVDAFTDEIFGGNPAAIVPLAEWLADETLQAIALENNLSETAFVIARGQGRYDLRWFTPGAEVPLCGHATLATAHVLYTEMGETAEKVVFETKSGALTVSKAAMAAESGGYAMDFPADPPEPIAMPGFLIDALGDDPSAVLAGQYILAVYDDAETVRSLTPNLLMMNRVSVERGVGAAQNCVCVTAPGEAGSGVDFVSRFFGPTVGITEDPVTGSAHCMLAPYWAARLGKDELNAFQASARGGKVGCRLAGDRVVLSGRAVTYLRGRISL